MKDEPIANQYRYGQLGQSIVIIAFMLVALLAFIGLAADAGFLYMRASQFGADVDAAALAGVTEMTGGSVVDAQDRAVQFLAANGWPVTNTSAIITSEQRIGTLGIPEFSITVSVQVSTSFLRIIGIPNYRVMRWAQAAYSAQADMFTPTQYEMGKMAIANQFIFGPNSCTVLGDPLSPDFSTVGVANDLPERQVIRPDGEYRYRIRVRDDYITDTEQTVLRIELFDPDSINLVSGNSANVTHSLMAQSQGEPATETIGSCWGYTNGVSGLTSIGSADSCIIDTGESQSNPQTNGLWFNRVDEEWGDDCASLSGAGSRVVTRYTLYYVDADNNQIQIAQYTATNADANVTDMAWVSPGADAGVSTDFGSFVIPDITIVPMDEFGMRYVYLEVDAISGSSKNVFDIWAGPPTTFWATLPFTPTLTAMPAGVNLRNLAITDSLNTPITLDYPYPAYVHYWGVDVFASAYMPLEPHYIGTDMMRLPLMPIYTEQAGGGMYTSVFDIDSCCESGVPFPSTTGGQPDISFKFDTLGSSDFFMPWGGRTVIDPDTDPPTYSPPVGCWIPAYLNNCENLWIRPDPGQSGMNMGIPSIDTGVAFYGGTLTAYYIPGGDAHTWFGSVTSGRPFLTR